MRKLLSILGIIVVASGCGRDPQPADPQPVPPAAAPAPDEAAVMDTTAAGATGAPAAQPEPAAPQPQQPPQPAGPAPAQPQPQAPAPAAPQTDAQVRDGAAVLRRAAAAYENVRSLSADFVLNFENPLLRQRLTSRGTIYQRQPDRIALRFSDPEGDLIIGDGQYFWVYYPSNNPQQVIRAPAAAAGESAVNLQAQFIGDPVARFDHTLEGTESVAGRSAHVLMLVPRQRVEYRSLKVWIDERDSLARRFEITEHNGSIRRFDLSNLQVNPSIPDAVFRFTPPQGANIVTPR
jgi:outer membrane lipoprotein carrier protein